MNRRKFVFTSTLSMLLLTSAIVGLAFLSNFTASASLQELPRAIHYLPADCQAVFGMNVQKFIASPVYAQIEAQHGQQIGQDLTQFITATGVDPRRDVAYIIAAARPGAQKDSGVVLAVGNFNQATIVNFINTKATPVNRDYRGKTVLVNPGAAGTDAEKGIAFLSPSLIALGDLQSLNAVIDVQENVVGGIDTNVALSELMTPLNAADMFWFAGDGPRILSKAPANTPLAPTLSAVRSVFGTLNLTTTISGKVTVVASDEGAATKLSDFVRGLLALGSLASAQNADLAQLIQKVQIAQKVDRFEITIDIPFDLLQKLGVAAKGEIQEQMK